MPHMNKFERVYTFLSKYIKKTIAYELPPSLQQSIGLFLRYCEYHRK